MAVRSQDIYYNYITIDRCMKYYSENFRELNCVIFDMYDYNYFNYDISLLKNAINFYYSQGGIIEDEHNFLKNKFFEKSLKKELELKTKVISEQEILVRDLLFENIYGGFSELFSDLPREGEYTNTISFDEPLPARKFVSDLVQRRFEDTIKENINTFEKLLKLLKRIKPGIRIICILMPRFYTMELAMQGIMKEWKSEFESIIFQMQELYGIEYLNFKDCKDISNNPHFYKDVNHLNDIGAVAFTSLLNNILFDNKSCEIQIGK